MPWDLPFPQNGGSICPQDTRMAISPQRLIRSTYTARIARSSLRQHSFLVLFLHLYLLLYLLIYYRFDKVKVSSLSKRARDVWSQWVVAQVEQHIRNRKPFVGISFPLRCDGLLTLKRLPSPSWFSLLHLYCYLCCYLWFCVMQRHIFKRKFY